MLFSFFGVCAQSHWAPTPFYRLFLTCRPVGLVFCPLCLASCETSTGPPPKRVGPCTATPPRAVHEPNLRWFSSTGRPVEWKKLTKQEMGHGGQDESGKMNMPNESAEEEA